MLTPVIQSIEDMATIPLFTLAKTHINRIICTKQKSKSKTFTHSDASHLHNVVITVKGCEHA